MLRTSLRLGLVGALIGAAYGVFSALSTISQNSYFDHALQHHAARLMASTTLSGSLIGTMIALSLVAVALVAWPLAGLIFRSRGKTAAGALAAALLAPAYLVAAAKLNSWLPALLSPTSIAGNLGLLTLAFTCWYFLARGLGSLPSLTQNQGGSSRLAYAGAALLALILASTQLLPRAFPAAIGADRPNVIIFMIDALRADRLGQYGYQRDTSPNLDSLAKDGWTFTQAISPAPWTKPSIASLFTSMYPRQHGIFSAAWSHRDASGATKVHALSSEFDTLAETLSNAGYRTGAFGENHHLLPRLGFAQGFQSYDLGLMDIAPSTRVSREVRASLNGYWAGALADNSPTVAQRLTSHFMRWLGVGDQPFFGYLHHIDVHWPYEAPEPYSGKFGSKKSDFDFNDVAFMQQSHHDRNPGDPPLELDPEVLESMSAAYDEGILFVDAEIGSVIDELKERGIYDNTLIVVTADHGEEFLDHGELLHGSSLYDVLIRVPLIIKFPCPGPSCSARIVGEQAQLTDIMPTILAALGLDPPEGSFGVDLASPETLRERIVFSQMGDRVALRTPDFKYIYEFEDSYEELYQLSSDPQEKRNVAGELAETTAHFRDRLFEWMAEVEAANPDEGGAVTADPDMLEKLKALGYLE